MEKLNEEISNLAGIDNTSYNYYQFGDSYFILKNGSITVAHQKNGFIRYKL